MITFYLQHLQWLSPNCSNILYVVANVRYDIHPLDRIMLGYCKCFCTTSDIQIYIYRSGFSILPLLPTYDLFVIALFLVLTRDWLCRSNVLYLFCFFFSWTSCYAPRSTLSSVVTWSSTLWVPWSAFSRAWWNGLSTVSWWLVCKAWSRVRDRSQTTEATSAQRSVTQSISESIITKSISE